ncbi:hypothetical protein [Adhaeribacter terreus]|uniref:Outer membrane protein beta-barrel domain-containing protein n=1 Tax=Adhaeribacter terreus TaxID=529703 RepID=A0ABW0E925_9BACT
MKAVLLFFLVGIAFWPLQVRAQQTAEVVQQKQAGFLRNGTYVEAGGNALYGSLNYERRFFVQGDPVAAIRVGGSLVPFDYWHSLILPVEFSLINGKRPLKFEFGAGVTFLKSFEREEKVRNDRVGVYINPGFRPIANFRLGARYDFPDKPYFLRAGFTPFFFNNGEGFPGFQPWGGVSFGYSFGKK